MKKLIKSELRKLVKVKSLDEIAEDYGVTYERIRQICVMWRIDRRGWNRMAKIDLVDDEEGEIPDNGQEGLIDTK